MKRHYQDFEFGKAEPMVGRVADVASNILAERPAIKDNALDGTLKGSFASINVDTHIQFFSSDMVFEKDNDMRSSVPAGLWVGALYCGDHETLFGNHLVKFPGNGVPSVLTFGEETPHIERYSANRQLRMSSYLVSLAFFQRAQAAAPETPMGRLAGLIKPGVTQHSVSAEGRVSDALLALMNNPYHGPLARLFVESTVMASLFDLAQDLCGETEPKAKQNLPTQQVAEARHLIDTQPDQFGSIHALSRSLGTNETTLQRQFKADTGLTIFQYVLQRRMQSARVLIRDGSMPISQIAYKMGYNSPANFSTAYKRHHGHAPAQDRTAQG